MFNRSNNQGFTIIELIIYMGLFAIIMTSVLLGVYQIIDSTKSLQKKVVMQEEANFILRKIDWALDSASAITEPAIGNSGQSLVITKDGFGNNPLTFNFNNGQLTLQRGTGAENILNTVNVSLSAVTFEHLASVSGPLGTKPEAVRIVLVINGQNFESTRYLRN